MENIIHQIIPKQLRKKLEQFFFSYSDFYAQKTFSQEGEDLILRKFFGRRDTGFYVDVGAHHPKRFSNTYYFYKLGWRGINIDATPGSMRLFAKFRPKDINLEIPVSDKPESLTYFIFNEPALNTFSKELYEQRIKEGKYNLLKTTELKVQPLNSILDSYLPKNTKIDFLTVDVEGFDLQVLKSIDLTNYRPKLILAEVIETSIENIFESSLFNLVKSNGYDFFAKTFNTVFFKRRDIKSDE